MFLNPFSFNGRISKNEYILSTILSFTLLIIFFALGKGYKHSYLFLMFIKIIYLWFNLSQGTKRCHDIDEHGIMQIVPFYIFTLLFTEGKQQVNEYGNPPLLKHTNKPLVLNTLKFKETFQIILPFTILNTFFIAVIFEFIKNEFLFNISIYISIILTYLLFLFICKKEFYKATPHIHYQIFYSFTLFFLSKIYFSFFIRYSFSFSTLLIELFLIFIPFSLTFISKKIFNHSLNLNEIEKI